MIENASYPSTPEEYEEYKRVMDAMADEAEASTPDPQPEDFKLTPQEENLEYLIGSPEEIFG
ncbi:hypothetical protein N9955_00595 [bacterium]|nr:hypothetical protein [bacterium]